MEADRKYRKDDRGNKREKKEKEGKEKRPASHLVARLIVGCVGKRREDRRMGRLVIIRLHLHKQVLQRALRG